MKILIIEDEPELLKLMNNFLLDQGYIVEKASSLFDAEDKLLSFTYDIVLLDITLPDGTGLRLLELFKYDISDMAVIIISAKNSLDDKIDGLNLGADDYITKPFHLTELNARINAVTRRKKLNGTKKVVFNEITILTDNKEVLIHEKLITLTKKEYDVLLYFVINKNKMLTKETIAEHLWGDSIDLVDNFKFVYTHIANLRKKIKDADGYNYFKSSYGMGYKFTDK